MYIGVKCVQCDSKLIKKRAKKYTYFIIGEHKQKWNSYASNEQEKNTINFNEW